MGGFTTTSSRPACPASSWDCPPVLAEVHPISKIVKSDRPSYSFKTSKSGTLNFSGKCKGNVDMAVAGVNHIALLTGEPGAYDDCSLTPPIPPTTAACLSRSLPSLWLKAPRRIQQDASF